MKHIELAMIIGFILTIPLSAFAGFIGTADEIREQTLRLHIIANSDSHEDQSAKLAVRDALLIEKGELFMTATDVGGAQEIIEHEREEIIELTHDTLAEYDMEHDVFVDLTRMYFPTTSYEGFTMPAGYYDAVRITIGAAEGENWWCVLFPPLCIPSAQGEVPALEMFDEEEQELIMNDIDVRFKVVEVFEEWFGE